MFNNTTHQRLVHLPRHPPKPEADLPRGECRFLHPDRDSESGARQRCICQSFTLNKTLGIGTNCECGHPAWTHVQQPMAAVTYEEHMAVVEDMRRFKKEQETKFRNLQHELVRTQHELLAQRAQFAERERLFKAIEARMYQNMKDMKIELDDKMDGMIDQQHAFQKKLIDVEDATMEHEIHFEKLGISNKGVSSRSLTPVVEALPDAPSMDDHSMDTAVEDGPVAPEKRFQPWSARVIFVPRRTQLFAFDVDSKAYRRCQSRNLQQNLDFANTDSISFTTLIDKAFSHVLEGRSWMPLVGYRPPDDHFGRMTLRQLPRDLSASELWDYYFLDHHCIAHDKMQGDVLYIALREADLTWNDMKHLSSTVGSDESIWAHDPELDGPLFGFKRLDADLMYEYSAPPPYSSQRAHAEMDRLQTPLGVLAASASVLAPLTKEPTATSLRSLGTDDGSDGEHSHRDKIRKVRPKRSEPVMRGVPSSSSHGQTVYYSGRSKRKMPVREKQKEPLQIPTSFRLTNILHHRNKEEAAQ